MTSKCRKWLSALLAVLMVLTPITASLAEDGVVEIAPADDFAGGAPGTAQESDPAEAASGSMEEQLIPEDEVQGREAQEEVVEISGDFEELISEEDGLENSGDSIDDGRDSAEQTGEAPADAGPEAAEHSSDEAGSTSSEAAEPAVLADSICATQLDVSGVDSPLYVPFGAPEGELPLPAELPARFSDGSREAVPVLWSCTGNTFDEQGYIPDCEDRDVVFYFHATPVGVECAQDMILPAVTVMYAPDPGEEAIDHEGITFAGTDILISSEAVVSTDDILNETGYDASYRIVNEGVIAAGESEAAIENPVELRDGGAIRGGTFNGGIEIAGGDIYGGVFNGQITCKRGAFHGGTFYGSIAGPEHQIYATINGGEFHGDIGTSEYDGFIFIHGGTFYSNIKCYNLTVDGDSTFYNAEGEGGARRTVTLGSVGNIAGGVFYADVLNRNNITDGTFYGKVTNGGTERNCNVLGGTFYGEFDNAAGGKIYKYGESGGARFLGEAALRNSSVLDAGEDVSFSEEMVITNESDGIIESGYYPCKVVNYGTIAGGSFAAGVVNLGKICGGSLDGEIYNEGGTIAGASLNGMLMSNTGRITLENLYVDEAEKTITIASGHSFTIDEILGALEGDPAEYIIDNEGEITGGEATLPCDFAADSLGDISNGTYSGTIYANSISGGTFAGSVCANAISGGAFAGGVRANSISDGSFGGRVIVRDNITGGSFSEGSAVTAGMITGGAFAGEITSAEREKDGFITITGGQFTGSVAARAGDGIVINGGTFDCNIGHRVSGDAFNGYVIIRRAEGVAEPRFNGEYVGGHNVVIEWGVFSEGTRVVMYSMGSLAGGTYYGPVVCNNAIVAGEFHGEVTMTASGSQNGQIHGGIFHGKVNNRENCFINMKGYEGNPPPQFLEGEIENEGEMDPGEGTKFSPEMKIVNRPTGSIRSGVYDCPVINEGAMPGGIYNAPVTTYKSIAASPAMFKSALLSVPDRTIDIPLGESMTISEIKALEGYNENLQIVNSGAITGEAGDVLNNDIDCVTTGKGQVGTIDGGTYYGTITGDGYIKDGVFHGEVTSQGDEYLVRIDGGEFHCPVATRGDKDGAVIYGGHFYEAVGKSGDGHILIYRSGAPGGQEDNAKAVFDGPVAAYNLVISIGTFHGPVELSSVGRLDGGVFYGPVVCNNAISGGEFHDKVTIATKPNGQIYGGVFYGQVYNTDEAVICRDGYTSPDGTSQYGPPQFLGGEVNNASKMDPGEETVFGEDVKIVNQTNGSILSGIYHGPMENYGTISNAVLYGKVMNKGAIINSVVLGQISGDGAVTVDGVAREGNFITVEKSIPAASIKTAIGSTPEEQIVVINKATISGGADATLACTVIGGTISGGSYSGSVYAKRIQGGSFSGPVYCLDRKTYAGMSAEIRAAVRGAFGFNEGDVNPEALLGGLAIYGGAFANSVGDSDAAIFIHGGDFTNCKGVTAYNLTVDQDREDGASIPFGAQCPVHFTVGSIAGGKFAGSVTSGNTITGGTFDGPVTNRDAIYGGTFNGGIENYGIIDGEATYTAYSEDWTFNAEMHQWEPNGDPYQKRVTNADVAVNCTINNYSGGVVRGMVKEGEGFSVNDHGGKFETFGLIATAEGESRVYSGESMICGALAINALRAIDISESVESSWKQLNGSAIGSDQRISSNPAQNVFLRDPKYSVEDGVLELKTGWSSEAEEPAVAHNSVHIPAGQTVSTGNWLKPVNNEGDITGGTYQNITNSGTITGATINGAITAIAGSIANCAFGEGASVLRKEEGATIEICYTIDGELEQPDGREAAQKIRTAQYGDNVLAALNAVQQPGRGYDWYWKNRNRTVGASDTFALRAADNVFEIRNSPAPAIIWPTDATVGLNKPLSEATFTDDDPNGSFSWKNPSSFSKQTGSVQFEMVYQPDPGNTYVYAPEALSKMVSVRVVARVITVTVNSATIVYGEAEPEYSCKIDGLKEGESINRRFVRAPGNDVGKYQISVEVIVKPKDCEVKIIPGELTITPRTIATTAVASIWEGNRGYYEGTRYAKSFTGEALAPDVKVTYLGKALVRDRDYTVAYRDNIEPGTAHIDIEGKGNYTGKITREFYISAGVANVRVESCSKEYGQSDPAFRATVSGISGQYASKVGYTLRRLPGENVGTYSILADQTADSAFELNVTPGILTITPKQLPASVTAPAAQNYNGRPLQPKPTVRDGSKTLTEGVDYTLSYENNVNAGTATVFITGMGNYAGTQSAQFGINKASARIVVNSAQKDYGASDPAFTASVTGELGERINYTLTRDAGEAVGSYSITAKLGNNPNYDVSVTPGRLSILPVVTAVQISPNKLSMSEGDDRALSYRVEPAQAVTTVSYSSSNPGVASVSPEGAVHANAAGMATIEICTANGKTNSCEVIVLPVPVNYSIGNGETVQLTPRGGHATEYVSSNPSVAEVDNSGKVTARSKGRTTIKASAGSLQLAIWDLEVTPAPTQVSLSETSVKLGVGQGLKLVAETDEGGKDFQWKSSKPAIVTVDSQGNLMGKKAGSATVSVKTYNGKSASCKVTVKKAPSSIKLSISKITLGKGESAALKATLSKGSDCTIEYVSTNREIARYEDGRIIAGESLGTATITARTYNGKSANCTVTVAPSPTAIRLDEKIKMGVKQSMQLPVTMEPAGAHASLEYESSEPDIVSVDKKGKVKALKANGTEAVITVRTQNGLEASVQISVVKAPSKVTLSTHKESLGAGQSFQLSAKLPAGSESKITWSSSKKSVATVDQTGKVTALKAGSATITAKAYNGKKDTCKITVSKGPSSISLNLTHVEMAVGEKGRALKATLSKKSGSTITYEYDRSVISLEKGKIVPKAPGRTTIRASTFNGLSAECEVTITAAPTSVELGENRELKVKGSLTLHPQFENGEGGSVSYKSSKSSVASVNSQGKVTAKKAGRATITVTTFNGKKDTIVITVKK